MRLFALLFAHLFEQVLLEEIGGLAGEECVRECDDVRRLVVRQEKVVHQAADLILREPALQEVLEWRRRDKVRDGPVERVASKLFGSRHTASAHRQPGGKSARPGTVFDYQPVYCAVE